MYQLSNKSISRMEGIHPFLKAIINEAIRHEDCPDDFGIPPYGGFRTADDQQKLYAKGRTDFTTHSKPVTYVDGIRKKSKHQIGKYGYGEAFDVYIYDHATNRASWNVERLEMLAKHIIKCSEIVKLKNDEFKDFELTWGGNFKRFKDYPHYQMDLKRQ